MIRERSNALKSFSLTSGERAGVGNGPVSFSGSLAQRVVGRVFVHFAQGGVIEASLDEEVRAGVH